MVGEPKTALVIEGVTAPTARGLEEATLEVAGGRIGRILPVAGRSGARPCAVAGRSGARPCAVAGRSGARPPAVTGSVRRVDGGGRLAVPGFVDLHVHGAMGVDVTDVSPDGAGLDALRRLSRTLAGHGVTGFCATTVSARRDRLRRALEAVALAVAEPADAWPGARVLGSHSEGPFLSAARRGAQPLEALRPPELTEIESLYAASRGTLRVLTLAPELPGARAAVRWLASRGVIAAAGHTDATYDEAEAAIAAGVTQSAHTFNGMRPFGHRDPGVVGAIMNHDEVLAEVIADGVHVSPHVVRLLCRVKGVRRVAVVTDLTHLAGLAPGEHDFAGERVVVNAPGAFVKRTGGLAGSVTPMNLAFRNLLAWGFTVEEAVLLTSANARRQLGLPGGSGILEEGAPADITVIGRDGGVALTLVGGRIAP